MKKMIICLILAFSMNLSFGQEKVLKSLEISGFVRDEAGVSTDRKKREFYLKKKNRGDFKQINIDTDSKDTVFVYLNDSLIATKWIEKEELSLASFKARFQFNTTAYDKRKFVTIVFKEQKRFIHFKVKKNFYFINVYYLKRWVVNHTNNIPVE